VRNEANDEANAKPEPVVVHLEALEMKAEEPLQDEEGEQGEANEKEDS